MKVNADMSFYYERSYTNISIILLFRRKKRNENKNGGRNIPKNRKNEYFAVYWFDVDFTCIVYEGIICIEYVWRILRHVQCELALHLDDLIRVHYSSIGIRC